MIKVRTWVNETENNKTIKKTNVVNSGFLTKSIAGLIKGKKKRNRTEISNTGNGKITLLLILQINKYYCIMNKLMAIN